MSTEDDEILIYNPAFGTLIISPGITAKSYRESLKLKWFYNPYTGERRDADDIKQDPYGQFIIPPVECSAKTC